MELPMAERRGPLFTTLFVRAAARTRPDLAPIVERFRPDVIVRETGELAAAPMAAARSIPLVTVAFSGVLPDGARAQVLEGLRSLWHDEGLDAPSWADVYGQLYLHPFPVSFGQRPDSAVVRPLRCRVGVPSAEPPTWVAELGVDRPLVYVTAGTERPAVTFPWRETFAALQHLPVDVLATIGPHVDPERLGDVPNNVRVERFVPQADVLGRATVVVSHGGAGTVLGAASQGRPQLVVPLFADQWENGVAVSDAGCGIVLGPDRRTVDDLDGAVRALLAGSHDDAATRVAEEIAAMPTATERAAEIESLAEDQPRAS
jgi:UDP:flavonoid glycosyltransferase YjiC (YdhE family)